MINWNTNEEKFKKEYPQEYKLWRLTQLINYGLDGEKLSRSQLKRVWPQIKDNLDPDKKKVLEFFLWRKPWQKEPGLNPDRSSFWNWFLKTRT